MKKTVWLSCITGLAIATSSAFAGGFTHEPDSMPVVDSAGFTLGMNYATWGESDFAIMGGYVNPWFSASIGGNYEDNNNTLSSQGKSTLYELRAELGLRHFIAHSIYFTYGATTSQGFRSPRNTLARTEPYQYGAYIGLDYQPLEHLLLSTQILPYSYEHGSDRVNRSFVFSDGTIAASYIF